MNLGLAVTALKKVEKLGKCITQNTLRRSSLPWAWTLLDWKRNFFTRFCSCSFLVSS